MTIEQLQALEEIKQLKARYFRLLDTKDWSGWRELFTDDFVACVDGVSNLAESGDDFVRTVSALLEGSTTVHHGHMPEITLVDAERATGIWAMEDIVELPGEPTHRGHGHYHESYRKVGGRWRIATLNLTRLRNEHTPRPSGEATR